MFRSLLVLVFILASTNLFAMPCPNGSGILYKGDLLDKVVLQCGKPDDIREYEKTIPVLVSWTFYKRDNFNSNVNTKITILFRNNQIVNIEIQANNGNTQNLASTAVCGMFIRQGEGMQKVESACGKPNFYQVLENKQIEYKELKYSGTHPQTLVFESNQLIDFK